MLRNKHNRYLRSYELLPLLGFRAGGHLPPEGFAPKVLEGTNFRCLPATPGRRKHRIEYLCGCFKWVPYGRASQHKCFVHHGLDYNPAHVGDR